MMVVKAASVDYIRRFIEENQGRLPYVEFEIDASLNDVLLYFKRFSLVLLNNYLTPD